MIRTSPAPRRSGFTLLELLVAISISVLLFGACIALYIRAARFKSRSEERLFMYEDARGVADRMTRDLRGMFVIDSDGDGTLERSDYLEYVDQWHPPDTWGDLIRISSATENPGKADFCTVAYYVEGGKLYRELSHSMGGVEPDPPGWPAKPQSVLLDNIRKLELELIPAIGLIADGKLPRIIRVTLELEDENSVSGYQRFSFDVRPLAEEQ